jgi:hypothetical protein
LNLRASVQTFAANTLPCLPTNTQEARYDFVTDREAGQQRDQHSP